MSAIKITRFVGLTQNMLFLGDDGKCSITENILRYRVIS